MNELLPLHKYIYSRLLANAGIGALVGTRVYRNFAPETTVESGATPDPPPFPFIVFRMLSPGDDTVSVGGHRVLMRPLYSIAAIGDGSVNAALQTLSSLIDVQMHNPPPVQISQSGVTIELCGVLRESTIDNEAVVNGIRVLRTGGNYRYYLNGVS